MDSPAELRDAAKPPRPISSGNSDVSSSTTEGDKQSSVKKLPPNKAPVGLAKGPDLKNCKSKVGSLHNIKHTPAGGAVTIQTQKLNWNAKSKIGSLENKEHKPGGGNLKVESRKLEWKTTSKVQSLQNVKHKPGGGNVKIFNETYFEKTAKKPAEANADSDNSKASAQDTAKIVSAGHQAHGTGNDSNSLVKDMRNLKLKS